jgi:hypothetical protein
MDKAARYDGRQGRVAAHLGRPVEVLKELLVGAGCAGVHYFGVSGHPRHFSEAAAGT